MQGAADLQRRWSAIPRRVRAAVRETLEKTATEIVADMESVKPLPEIEIKWTWGAAPKGSISMGDFGSEEGEENRITIYAWAPDFAASWFEHGTAPRYTKTGKFTGQIIAQPFFYPIWRLWRRRIKTRITRAINKALKSA